MEVLVASDNRPPMSADLLRQRRNLLVTSLALTAIELAGATLKKDVSVLGASLEFTNPERIVWGLWILWAYFLVRYWQYLNEEPDLGIHKGMERWINRRISWDESVKGFQHVIVWRYRVFWTMMMKDENWGDEEWTISLNDPSRRLLKAIWTLRAFFSVAAKTPRFTDYVVPFFVASVPFFLCAWGFLTLGSAPQPKTDSIQPLLGPREPPRLDCHSKGIVSVNDTPSYALPSMFNQNAELHSAPNDCEPPALQEVEPPHTLWVVHPSRFQI